MRIGKRLGRAAENVRHRYIRLSPQKVLEPKAELKTGPYTSEEDAAILRLYREDNSRGVFVRIGKRLGRAGENVRSRYIRYLKQNI